MAVKGQSLGIGLNEVAFYSTQLPFLDLFKTSPGWITHSDTEWDTQESAQLDRDENGWVRSLPATQTNSQPPRYNQIGTLMLWDIPNTYPSGRYVVVYDGVGTMDYRGARKVDAASRPGRDVIEIDSSGNGLNLRITATDPNRTGDYIRNVRVYREADLPLVELGLTFNPEFLQKIKEFGTLRFMDWMRANFTQQREWSDRPKPSDFTWGTQDRGIPVEIMVELANLTGTSPWFTMPYQASDDYIRRFAEYVRANLDPNLQVYVEFSNEVWNWGFPQSQYALQQARARWGDVEGGWMQWYGMRTAQTAQIWKSAFGPASGRVTAVMGTQTYWQGLENYALDTPAWVAEGNQPAWKSVDAYAIAGYFSGGLGSYDNTRTVLSWLNDPDGGFGKAIQQLRSGGLLPSGDSLAETFKVFQYHAQVARQRGLKLVAYEGGQHLVNSGIPNGTQAENDRLNNFFIALNRRPEMQQLYQELLNGWKAAGGELFNHFVDVNQPSRYGSWGALENLTQTTSPKYAALMNFIQQNDRWWTESDTQRKLGLYRRGTAANDTLNGGNDDDILLGGEGNDIINGSVGNDRLHGEAGTDLIRGDAGNDRIVGGAGDDTLDGGVGEDVMAGSVGNDTYQVDNIKDTTTEAANEGDDTVQATVTSRLEANLENLTLTGSSAISGTGNDLNNRLTGNGANNTLSGLAGNDTIVGGAGNDMIWGGSGDDAMTGGTGNDTYEVDSSLDVVTEALWQETDTVQASISYLLGSNVENLVLTGSSAINGTGNSLVNSLTGNGANNALEGGAGNDVMTGGAGSDQFVYAATIAYSSSAFGQDSITDFSSGTDQIVLDLTAFTALTSRAGSGFSNASEFAIVTSNTAAQTSPARIVYNRLNGNLIYNQNGGTAGFGTGSVFAVLSGNPTIAARDFLIQP
ncbi:MAG: calcium-binding protein [Elainella sp.]